MKERVGETNEGGGQTDLSTSEFWWLRMAA